jgi:hypothetical protein
MAIGWPSYQIEGRTSARDRSIHRLTSDALHVDEPADVQHRPRPRRWRLAVARIGNEVGLDPSSLRRQAALDEPLPGEVVQREEEPNVTVPRAELPVDRDGAGGRRGRHHRVAIAAVTDASPRVGAHAVMAGPAVTEQHPVDAQQPIVVQGHDHRDPGAAECDDHRGGEGEPGVVHVGDLWACPVDRLTECPGGDGIPGRHGQGRRGGQPTGRVVDLVPDDLVAGSDEQIRLGAGDDVLAARLPVACVYLQDPHR